MSVDLIQHHLFLVVSNNDAIQSASDVSSCVVLKPSNEDADKNKLAAQ